MAETILSGTKGAIINGKYMEFKTPYEVNEFDTVQYVTSDKSSPSEEDQLSLNAAWTYMLYLVQTYALPNLTPKEIEEYKAAKQLLNKTVYYEVIRPKDFY